MVLNEDLSVCTLVHAGSMDWVPSPAAGVERRMLFRIGEEKARATSIVRYAPGSRFARHEHNGGEEFLVLEGIFQDESGDFPTGTYVRNPPGTSHAPGSESGCTILVKLWQFAADDQQRVVSKPSESRLATSRPGVVASRTLFEAAGEQVMLEEWTAGGAIHLPNPDGLELLVLDGDLSEGGDRLIRWSWLRMPPGASFHATVGSKGARVWWKAAPLLHPDVVQFDISGKV